MFCLETDSCRAVSRCFTSAEPKTLSCARSLAQEKDRVLRALFFTTFAIHMGVPCGTSSKARGRPLRNGALGLQPLRSKAFPLGLPSLDWLSADGQRVVAANKLYSFAFRVLDFCKTNNIIACIENPANSHLWDILQAFEPQAQGQQCLVRFF